MTLSFEDGENDELHLSFSLFHRRKRRRKENVNAVSGTILTVQLGTEILSQSGTSTKNESLGHTNQSGPSKKRGLVDNSVGRREADDKGGGEEGDES